MSDLDRRAPSGMFRLICVDTFDRNDWIEGDYASRTEAMDQARRLGGPMLKAHIYDDHGRHVGEAGSF